MFLFDAYIWAATALAIIAANVVLIYWYTTRNSNYWKNSGIPYTPNMGLFAIRKLLKTKPINEFALENYQKYGRLFGSFDFYKPNISVGDPELLKNILVKDFGSFTCRRDMYLGDEISDNMVSILKGEDWKRVRTLITPAFTSRRMRHMSSIINDCSSSTLETIGKHYQKQEPVDFKKLFGAFTMDVIASSAFATKIDSHQDPNNPFVQEVQKNFLEISLFKFALIQILPKWAVKQLKLGMFGGTGFFTDITVRIIEERNRKGERYNDFLQLMIDASEEGIKAENESYAEDEVDQFGSISNADSNTTMKYKKLSRTELLAQCVLFFFVGFETTASTLSFMAYSLATNPEWQEKLLAEVDETFEKHNEMSYDAVRNMKVLDAIVSETLRMYPVLTVSERTATEDYKLGNTGVVIPKGMAVQIPIYGLHYDEEFYENPTVFDPTRFLDPSKAKHHQYAYLPFGAGPRNCLGMRFALMEMKMCICNILKHYRLKVAPTTKVPPEYRKEFALLSVNSLPLMVEKRSD